MSPIQDIADKIRRALRNGTGATFTNAQVREMARCGILHELARQEADEYCRSVGVAPVASKGAIFEPAAPIVPAPAPSPPSNYSVSTLAEHWDCSDGLIRKLISEGKLQCRRYGKLIRISQEEVTRYEQGGPL